MLMMVGTASEQMRRGTGMGVIRVNLSVPDWVITLKISGIFKNRREITENIPMPGGSVPNFNQILQKDRHGKTPVALFSGTISEKCGEYIR